MSAGASTSAPGLSGYNRIALVDRRRRRTSLRHNPIVKAERQRLWSIRNRARKADIAKEREEKRKFFRRAQGVFGLTERLPSYKWKLLSAAAAAGLSWTLCSSSIANAITIDGPVQMPNKLVSENLKPYVESQLRRELQAQIKVQQDWLEEIGQPLSQWSIDDDIRKSLEERTRTRLDESGKVVTKLELLESEVVPIFKPTTVALKKDKNVDAGRTSAPSVAALKKEEVLGSRIASSALEAPQVKASSQSSPVAVEKKDSPAEKASSQVVKATVDGAAQLVAVASVPLGTVVAAAKRTVGSAASIAAIQVAAPAVPVSFVARLISHFGGGGVAGAMGATLVYPLDTIKTRMQAQKDGNDVSILLCAFMLSLHVNIFMDGLQPILGLYYH